MVTWLDEKSDRADGTIPQISDKELEVLLSKYSALIRREGKFYRIKNPDPRRTAYTWDPTLLEEVQFEPMHRHDTVFPCGYHGFFKPSLAEVLCQRPDQIVIFPDINAFWIDSEDEEVKVFTTGSAQLAPVIWGKI